MTNVTTYRKPQGRKNGVGWTKSVTPDNMENAEGQEERKRQNEVLHSILLGKRQEILRELQDNVGQSLNECHQRHLDSVGDVGDQALMNRERDRNIIVMEMRNRTRQFLDEALTCLREGTYGICAECGIDINHKRLQAIPFAKLCVACQSRAELLEQIERAEEREDR